MQNFTIISWEELITSDNVLFPQGTAVTIGGFDGPHKGHKALFDSVLAKAKEKNIPAGIITFFRPPAVIKNGNYEGDVSTLKLKLKKFSDYGFTFTVLIDFSAEFAKMDGREFFDILIKTTRLKYLAVGEDFSCGYRRGLGVGELKRLAPQIGFCFDSIKAVYLDGSLRISSTAIRNAVAVADFTLAERLLGYPFLFDIIGPPWIRTDENSVSAQRAYITQILPKCGRYKVLVKSINGTKEEAVFFVHKNEVVLRFEKKVPEQFSLKNLNNLDTIEFIV